jgi:L-ascorbate metabolism protein UlaG (beta-lactamase superfamily)
MKSSILLLLIFCFTSVSTIAQLTDAPDTFDVGDGELTIHPIVHGSVVFTYDGKTVFADPYGGAELYEEFNSPDIILITHTHGDHYNPETLAGLDTENTTFIVPQTVATAMGDAYSSQREILANDESTKLKNIGISAVAMYNLPGDESVRHQKGDGNGYVIQFGDRSVYISGDTEDTPEMRSLENIDIAFVCMNLPYTMDIERAASAVTEFQPDIVYPYHHRGQDIEAFRELVDAANTGVEVRLKDWYSN